MDRLELADQSMGVFLTLVQKGGGDLGTAQTLAQIDIAHSLRKLVEISDGPGERSEDGAQPPARREDRGPLYLRTPDGVVAPEWAHLVRQIADAARDGREIIITGPTI